MAQKKENAYDDKAVVQYDMYRIGGGCCHPDGNYHTHQLIRSGFTPPSP
ncbi:MAG: hypothetical protein WC516_01425 [Patescibacteria group bacterium]